MNDFKIVDFERYCPTCVHYPEDPSIEGGTCDICLSNPVRVDSRRPEKYEEKFEEAK